MTGYRLMHSSGLSCKCLRIAVWGGLRIWDLLNVRRTACLWGCDHPPVGEQWHSQRRWVKMEGSPARLIKSVFRILFSHRLLNMRLKQRRWKLFSLFFWETKFHWSRGVCSRRRLSTPESWCSQSRCFWTTPFYGAVGHEG